MINFNLLQPFFRDSNAALVFFLIVRFDPFSVELFRETVYFALSITNFFLHRANRTNQTLTRTLGNV